MTTQIEALNIALDYMNERLEDHDCKYQRHPATEAERINILADIETVKEALAQPAQEPAKDKYGVVAGISQGVEIPAGWKYYYIKPILPTHPESKDCNIQMDECSSQPESAPRCKTCGKWTNTPCTTPPQPKEPEQEPVAWMRKDETCTDCFVWERTDEHTIPLYTTPHKRTWAGLTDDDKMAFLAQDFGGNRLDAMDWAEKRLKEKNT